MSRFDSILDVHNGYLHGSSRPSKVLDDALSRIDSVDSRLHAMAFVDTVGAARAADEADLRYSVGRSRGPLDGVPVTIKDSINAAGMPWRHGSKGHEHLPPAAEDSPIAARLKSAGAVLLGKATMPDFGMLAAGVSSLYGTIRNPWNLDVNSGGSSAGGAAGVAAGIAYGTVGTDIAGSVRVPAAQCGLVAIKPTQGRIPHTPPSMTRSAGPIARSVEDVSVLYEVLSQPDARDTWSLPKENPVGEMLTGPKGLRVGVMLDLGYDQELDSSVEAAVRDAATALRYGGAKTVEIPPVFERDPFPSLDRVFQVRAWTEYGSIPDSRRDLVLEYIVNWASGADGRSAVQYERDLASVAASAAKIAALTNEYDVVVSPVIPVVSFPADAVCPTGPEPLRHCRFTEWFNQTTQPGVSLPFGFDVGLPIGVQLVGRRFDDRRLLEVARWLERERPFSMPWKDVMNGESDE